MGTSRGLPPGADAEWELELYVLGPGGRGDVALENLEPLLEHHLGGRYRLEVIDVMQEPQRAEAARVLATPTLLKVRPAPVHRIVGDMSVTDRVLVGLGLRRQLTWGRKER